MSKIAVAIWQVFFLAAGVRARKPFWLARQYSQNDDATSLEISDASSYSLKSKPRLSYPQLAKYMPQCYVLLLSAATVAGLPVPSTRVCVGCDPRSKGPQGDFDHGS